MKLILASGSPRRQQMLRDLGAVFSVQVPGIDETKKRGESALSYVRRLAVEKAEFAQRQFGQSTVPYAILAADTIVVYKNQVLGKPLDTKDAVRMLQKLSGKSHHVITAFCWRGMRTGKGRAKEVCIVEHSKTKVTFLKRPPEFWRWYVTTGEPMDKAGAYAAQGIGVSFIERVEGSYSNVVGLPFSQVLRAFEKAFGGGLREHCSKP